MAIGLLLAAIYLVPAALETKDIQEPFTAVFPYHKSYLTFLPGDEFANIVNFSFGCQALVILAAVIILRWSRASRKEGEKAGEETGREKPAADLQTGMWMLLSIVTMFMCTSFSIYVSKLLPKIQVATFAWRWLAVACLFTALVVAAAIDQLRHRAAISTVKLWSSRAALGAAVMVSLLFMAIQVVSSALSHTFHVQPSTYIDQGFTPKGSAHPNSLPGTSEVTLTPEGGSSQIIRWEPARREVMVNSQEQCTARLKSYNFPGWSAHVGRPARAALKRQRGGPAGRGAGRLAQT